MTATLVARPPEDRDPSPAPFGYASDDDMDEPWDEPRRPPVGNRAPTSPLLACVGEYFDTGNNGDDTLDDGDLPTLSLSKKTRTTPLLNGMTSTTRPLRPPSKLGLDEPFKTERREGSEQFWDQLNPPSSSTASKWENDDDEAPDDELASLEMQGIQKKKQEPPRRSHEYYADREVVSSNSEDQFCDVTSMLGNICGDNETHSPARQPMPRKRTLKPLNDIPMYENTVEEQTAIEVEYVEPDQIDKAGWSPDKKNSYLAAMARKAKADFTKSAPETTIGEEKKSEAQEDADETDVYSSFNATEKRKFLKMVNSGMTPTQSAKKVMDERESTSTPVSGRRGLAFWKKPKPERSLSPAGAPTPAKDVGSPVKVTVGDVQPMVGKKPKADDRVVPRELNFAPYETAGFDSDSEGEKVESDDEDDYVPITQDGQPGSRNAAAAAGVAAGVAVVAAGSAINAAAHKKATLPNAQDVLPKSGSNYYDAVRKEHDDEEQARRVSQLAQKASQQRAARMTARSPSGARNPIGKQTGFLVLSEDEEQMKETAPSKDEDDKATPRSGAKLSNKNSSAARFKVRGVRPVGFASLREDEVGLNMSQNGKQPVSRSAAGTAVGTASAFAEDAAVRDLVGNLTSPSSLGGDDISRLEQNLTRPGINSGLAVRTTIQNDEGDKSFDLVTPMSMAGSPRGRTVEVDGDRSVDLDNYLDSAAPYSNQQDQMSVVSGRSHWTAATGATNYTTSSRVRRPGAAKVRLANAKKAEKSAETKKGWHESIKNAAAKSQQRWDPKEGFAGYEEPVVDPRGVPSDDIIHIELKGMKKKSATVQDASNGEYHVATPSNILSTSLTRDAESEGDIVWEDEDEDEEEEEPHELQSENEDEHIVQRGMQSNNGNVIGDRLGETYEEEEFRGESFAAQTAVVDPRARSGVASDDPKGWVESMKVASTRFATNGAVWDPETGWQGIDEEMPAPSSPTAVRSATDPPASPPSNNRTPPPDPDGVAPAVITGGIIAVASSAVVAANANQGKSTEASPRNIDESLYPSASRSGQVIFSMYPGSTDSGDRLRPPSRASLSIGDADTITTAQDEKYVQIGDTGSVRSFTYNQSPGDAVPRKKLSRTAEDELAVVGGVTTGDFRDPLVQDDSIVEDDTAPLLVSNAFVRTAEVVNVVKEKNTQDDVNLFAHDSRNSFPKPENPAKQPSRRRGQGPVDIDEIDDMDFDDEDDDGETWASDQIRASSSVPSTVKAAVPKKALQTPPKIKAPEKDTSPLRDRRRGARTPRVDPSGNRSEASKSLRASDLSQLSSPNATPEFPESSREDPMGVKNSRSTSVRASQVLDSPKNDHSVVKNLARQWESRAAGSSPTSPTRSLGDLDQGAAAPSPKSLYPNEEWPGQDASHEDSPAGTAEWKSFLEKKVIAESAAAAKQSVARRSRPDPSEVRKRADPSGNDAGYSGDEEDVDDDSLFEFKPSMRDQTGAFPTAANSNPGELDDSFSDLSPIQAREEEYDDERRGMEAVSDTGTNIEQGSFLKRLQACAAPMIPKQFTQSQENSETVPSSHLAFLRSTPQGGSSSHFVPPNLCGRPDTVSEGGEQELRTPREPDRSSSAKRSKQRSSPRYSGSEVRSVASDDGFGARTSYLEAIAMEAAISKPKRHGSRGRMSDEKSRSSATSEVSLGSRRSERWQEFLDRKSVGISPDKQRTEVATSEHSSDVSKAAEKYAAQQVEEMMEAMSQKRDIDKQSQVREMIDLSTGVLSPNSSSGALSPLELKSMRSDGSKSTKSGRSVHKKNESARAAEELAAARVEAMMAAMTSQSLDEGEI